jgi:hypothetical protein
MTILDGCRGGLRQRMSDDRGNFFSDSVFVPTLYSNYKKYKFFLVSGRNHCNSKHAYIHLQDLKHMALYCLEQV